MLKIVDIVAVESCFSCWRKELIVVSSETTCVAVVTSIKY